MTTYDSVAPEISAPKTRSLLAQSFSRLMRNKLAVVSLIYIIILSLAAFFFADAITTYSFAEQELSANNAVPEWMTFMLPEGAEKYAHFDNSYILSADHLGRDVYSRVVHGARVSLSVAFVAAAISLIVGTVYGAVAGYAGGWVDNAMMRFIDFLYGFPALIVIILLQVYFKAVARQPEITGFRRTLVNINEAMGGMFFLFVAIGLVSWIGLARIARGQVLSIKNKEFIEAARAMGASDSRIVFKHILPNILGPLVVVETLSIPGYIFTEAFLSFIGLGVDAPTPSWGIMISDGIKALRTYPNQTIVPAVLLCLTTLAFISLGDGLRDAFDPKDIK